MEISQYLQLMVDRQASDLFFSSDFPVLIKIEGNFSPIDNEKKITAIKVKELAYSLMKEVYIKAFEENWEVNLGVSLADIGRFRVNVMRQKGEVAMVIRCIKSVPPSIEDLHLPEILKTVVLEKRGLILVSGATGSGKSTTLASMIDYRNESVAGHILTIEDPIEFIHGYKKSIVNQREVGTDTKSYGEALKNAMREAPDVILIGEIRDEYTMRNVINYAETGHLCLATIHASNAIETLERVINFFPNRVHKQLFMDLGHNIKAIICQRLIPGIDGKRWAAIELLTDTPFVKELIQTGRIDDIKETLERNIEKDIITFDQAIFELFRQGKISKSEAIDNADSKHNIEVKIRLMNDGAVNNTNFNGLTIE
jgi:twitching motility protein PilU